MHARKFIGICNYVEVFNEFLEKPSSVMDGKYLTQARDTKVTH